MEIMLAVQLIEVPCCFFWRERKNHFIQGYFYSVLLVVCMLIYANLRLIYKNNGKIYDVGYGQIQLVLDLAQK